MERRARRRHAGARGRRRRRRASRSWNPDGSLAEMSGNGTRIAARVADGPHRLRRRARARRAATRRRAPRRRAALRVRHGRGRGRRARDASTGIELTPVDVGNPHAVVVGDPDDLPLIGPLLETHPRFPNRTNVQVARIDGAGRGDGARLGARRGGDDARRARARSRSRRRRTARATCSCTSPAATCACACDGRPARRSTGPAGAPSLRLGADLVLAQHVVERRLQSRSARSACR